MTTALPARLAAIALARPKLQLVPLLGETILFGRAASPGLSVGVAAVRRVFPPALVRGEGAQRDKEIEAQRIDGARERTREDLVRLQSRAAVAIGEEHALIFTTHLLLLDDPTLARLLERAIADGSTAPVATDRAFDAIVHRFDDVLDPYIHERVEDFEDLRTRILGHLLDRSEEPDVDDRVVVSKRTMPSLIVELEAGGALGIASELGGTTSHGVLLARVLGLPAVTGVERLTDAVTAGDVMVIDGDEGRVVLRPSPETLAVVARRGAVTSGDGRLRRAR